MSHQAGLTLIEILITLFILSGAILCVLGDGRIRQKQYRGSIDQVTVFYHLENIHEAHWR